MEPRGITHNTSYYFMQGQMGMGYALTSSRLRFLSRIKVEATSLGKQPQSYEIPIEDKHI